MKKIIISLFLSTQIFSQAINLKGKLLDANTKEPIVYANISFLKSNKGISSLEDGTFNLEIDKKLLKEKVHVSCLNYKDSLVFAKELQNKTFFLNPKNIGLDEVIVSKKRNKKIVLDKVKRRVSPFHTSGIRMLGKYFPNKLKFDVFIDKVSIYFSKRNTHNAKFRIRIFSVDKKTGKPKEDILNESTPVLIREGQRVVELNLEEHYLEFPENGLFVVFEKLLIPSNSYKLDDFKKSIYYAPVIGLTKIKEYREINRIYYYNKGNWHKIPIPENDFSYVPAISLTLTN
ncbi:carboxypeptidase-like regulatory domain-containing protein [Tenacibaculum bernardetii]|uniref:carboxypeptidase-like regulatory domain-containing protein n=1 Tax=Tenacibaculum bernardetii TaxID=3021375 RepID=UPI0023B0A9DB|nr:carboxypeptidase-like regulatory domain-containing protein [Tenacibaculum bernardetii]